MGRSDMTRCNTEEKQNAAAAAAVVDVEAAMEVAVVAAVAVLSVIAELGDAVLAAATRRDRESTNYSFDRSPCIDFWSKQEILRGRI